MAVSFGSLPHDGVSAAKLQELRAALQAGASKSSNQEVIHIAEALFSRAPADYVENTPVQTMVEVASDVAAFYSAFQAEKSPVRVEVKSVTRSNHTAPVAAIMTAVGDRPFIIDTLNEVLHMHHLSQAAFLHPILEDAQGKAFSLVYIELELGFADTFLTALAQDIQHRFSELITVTDDFSSMMVHAETIARLIESGAGAASFSEFDRREHAQLLRWLADGGFVFLGYREWESDPKKGSPLTHCKSADLGLFRSSNSELQKLLEDTTRDAQYIGAESALVHFSRVLAKSPVHKTAPMELVTVKTPRIDGSKTKYYAFLGFLTSRAIAQEASSVPIIRRKLHNILELEGFSPNTHDYKEVVSIAGSIPKTDLLQYPLERLRKEIHLVFALRRKNQVRISYFLDPLKRFLALNIVLPRDRFSEPVRRNVQTYVESQLGVPLDSAQYQLSVTEYSLVVIRLLLPNPGLSDPKVDFRALESNVSDLTLTWNDQLIRALERVTGRALPEAERDWYRSAFPERYKATTVPAEAAEDLVVLTKLDETNPLEVVFAPTADVRFDPAYQIKLYRLGPRLTLSDTIPFLENIGFEVLSETMTTVSREGAAWAGMYDIRVHPRTNRAIDSEISSAVLVPGLKEVLLNVVENDKLNGLLVQPGLNTREINLLRTLINYLSQIKAISSRATVMEALGENPQLARSLLDYFSAKFDPRRFAGDMSARAVELTAIEVRMGTELKSVHRLIHDRSVRALLNVLQSAVRTNFYQAKAGFRLALKIDSSKVTNIPKPKPLFEIFVTAPDFEGVHLRGGKVARGGLRWSERKEDYRTEVLGLMKTQMVKNSIIVPVGAKGGFFIKQTLGEGKELQAQVRNAYSRFIRSLLELADNRVNDEVVSPADTVVHDESDPYFVVAADKGTATFSDLANSIAANEFGFWLDDAFASGGSNGYDHKKLAITARGAWEAVSRHFREIGIDIENQDFSAVGIGDMAGDVFGNGMLLSNHIKLIGAFNHKHIFIDPTPDAATSFAERRRLFDLPGSQWSDYSPALITPGGGIFNRSAKEIDVSAEAAKALGCAAGVMSGEELIKAILRAPVDLLWNGGIGTYVKAYEEDDIHVGDRANDEVRVNARELRVKVIGEGGNLGLTQLGRIEYSKIGGHCNTDAVDNSGGVAMSDIEVNLKILLSEPVRRGDLTFESRNALLTSLSDECCEKVVSRNRTQSRAISLAVRRSRKNLGYYRSLIAALETEGFVNRESEALPDDETFEKRMALKAGLTRPELAVLIACSKMSLFKVIMESSIPEEPFAQEYLFGYFPAVLSENFKNDIARHPLRREIIATQIANIAVECMGASFFHRTAEESGAQRKDVLAAFLAAYAIAGGEAIVSQLRTLDRVTTTRTFLVSLLQVSSALDGMTRWVLDHRDKKLGLSALVEKYRTPFESLLENTELLLTEAERSRFHETCRQLIAQEVPKELAKKVTAITHANAYLDAIEIADRIGKNPIDVSQLYTELASQLHVLQILEQVRELEPSDPWESLATRTLAGDVRRSLARLARLVIEETGSPSAAGAIQYLAKRQESFSRYRASVAEFNTKPISISALMVISNQLGALTRAPE